MRSFGWIIPFVFFSLACATSAPPFGLRTGHHIEKKVVAQPLENVFLSWKLPSFSSVFIDDADPNVMHHARQIIQRSFEVEIFDGGGKMWSSGRVDSASQHLHLGYSAPLKHETDYKWRVRAWTENAAFSDNTHKSRRQPKWSKFFRFATVPARDSWDVRGSQWIGGFNQLRADFMLPSGTIQSARAFVTGVGAFYMSLNGETRKLHEKYSLIWCDFLVTYLGERVGDHVLDPGQTVYDVRTLFVDFDVTKLLKPGSNNTVGGELGHYKWTYLDTWSVVQ